MKLKLVAVVASMSALGLISGPAIAGAKQNDTNTTPAAHHDYKDYKGTAEKVCSITPNAMTMVEMSQNVGRSIPNPCNPGWFNRIRVSGGINLDLGKWGNRNANIMGENYQTLSLNDAYLNLTGQVNDWTTVFASLSYMTATTNANPAPYKGVGLAEYDAAYANNIGGTANNTLQIEQAFATVANFDETPVYLQVGKFYQDFSRYEIHPITASMTQVMSETLSTSLKLGFLVDNFNGSVFVFNDPINKIGASSTPTNYGVSVGYDLNNPDFGWDIGAAYLYNIIGANDVAWSVTNFTGGGYNSRVSAVALYGDVNYGPFMVAARYTQATQRFNVNDMTKNGNADLAAGSFAIGSGFAVTPAATATGAKPWAAGIQAGYGFDAWSMSQNVYLGYQTSREAAGLNLPKNRWLVGYGVDALKDTNVAAEWDHDTQFSTSNGGLGNATNLVSVRASVKFG
ncbi:MAG TPA: LbtU family siderophore porin [Gammaproteobacteria bacterium]|nr:LbtU family siderophore porin [Gammaproteobacteria bacterium]